MVSEKTNEEHLTNAIKSRITNFDINMIDYTTLPDNSITPGRYVVYIELKNSINEEERCNLEKVLDKSLRDSNLAYDRARSSNKLGRLKIILLKPNTFNKIKDILAKNEISQNQIKIPRGVASKYEVIRILEENNIK